jgi:hypothetical protein
MYLKKVSFKFYMYVILKYTVSCICAACRMPCDYPEQLKTTIGDGVVDLYCYSLLADLVERLD